MSNDGLPIPSTLYVNVICAAIGGRVVTNAAESDLIPISNKLQFAERLRIATVTQLVELEQCYCGLTVLITKFIVYRSRDAGRGDIMEKQVDAKAANDEDGDNHANNELRGSGGNGGGPTDI
jgi:hypothetical protein